MNKKDRKKLDEIVEALTNLQAEVAEFAEAEQEKHDNLSEGLQESEKGQALSDASEKLTEAADSLQEAIDAIQEAIEA